MRRSIAPRHKAATGSSWPEAGAFAVRYVDQMRGAPNHEELVAIDVDLGQLPVLQRILHRKRMETVELPELIHLLRARIGQPDPDELRPIDWAVDALVDGDLAYPAAMPV